MFDNKNVKPMLLKEVSEPFNDNNYLYEIKFDGIRAIIYVSKSEFVIKSRNDKDLSNIYSELKKDMQKLVAEKKVIFDGEIVVLKDGKPSFSKLISKTRGEVTFVVFDILFQDKELVNESLLKRKQILNKYKDTKYFVKSKVFSEGINLFRSIKKLGLEGIVAKDKASIYIPGKRVDAWLKIKNLKKDNFYVHGYVLNTSKYSLLLGEYRNNKLYFVGMVSVTKDNLILKELLKHKSYKNIFVNYEGLANYVRPTIRVLVKYLEKTDGGMLRQPILLR